MQNVTKTKRQIAHLIASRGTFDYNLNLEHIYNYRYKCIDKVPIKMFFIGLLQTSSDFTLDLIKEVVVESLEYSGLEVEFIDEDWDKLEVITLDNYWKTKKLNTTKSYMSEFFE